MSQEDYFKQLHDKATRGIALSTTEQAELDGWYAAQDQAEIEQLAKATPPQTFAMLQAQVETALEQLRTVTQRIQELSAQNETIRREIATLQRQLAKTLTPQSS
ncbi:MAG: hypothetical protein H0T73_14715 [Ardenticatenales bacterium]|nr:hypothetical protein [Ardenticatenales bacterium]